MNTTSLLPDCTQWQFPPRISNVLMAASSESRTDIAMGIAPLMGALATVAQGKFAVQVQHYQGAEYTSELSMFWICVADSGEGKGPVFKKIMAPIEAVVSELHIRQKAEYEKKKSYNASFDELIKSKRRTLKKHSQEMLADAMDEIAELETQKVLLTPPLVFSTQDGTAAGLRKLIAEQEGHRLGILDSEGISSRQLFEDPKLLSLLNQAYDRENLDAIRSSSPSYCELKGSVSIGIFMQKEKLMTLAKRTNAWGEGFFPRVLPVFPLSQVGIRLPLGTAVNHPLWREYAEKMRELLEYPWRQDGKPHLLLLSQSALTIWWNYSQQIEQLMLTGNPWAFLKPWLAKAPNAIVRIAALYHLFESGDPPVTSEISATHMQLAGDMVFKLIPHVQAIYKAIHPDPMVEVLKKIHTWLICHYGTSQTFTLRELYRATSVKRELALPAIQWFLQNGAVYAIETPYTGVGRPHSCCLGINFQILQNLSNGNSQCAHDNRVRVTC